MRIIGKEDPLEPLNRAALQIANEVSADTLPHHRSAASIF
jgi:hypothetical protein